MLKPSVSERLIDFALDCQARGVPEDVRHEAKRLLLNQLKASVGATQTDTVRILHESVAAPAADNAVPMITPAAVRASSAACSSGRAIAASA